MAHYCRKREKEGRKKVFVTRVMIFLIKLSIGKISVYSFSVFIFMTDNSRRKGNGWSERLL